MPRKYDYHCNGKTNEQVIQTTPEIKDMNTRLGVKARIELRKEFQKESQFVLGCVNT